MRVNFSAIAFSNGIALCGLAFIMCVPLFYDMLFLGANSIGIFVPSIILCIFLGVITMLASKSNYEDLSLKSQDTFLIVSSLWLTIAIFSSFPFYFYNEINLSFISSFFESTSGITTTGVSVYPNIEILPKALNLWRFILHFIGGIGIVAIAVVAFPFMRIGGMQLFLTENSDKSQKFLPRASQIATFFVGTYVVIIGIFAMLLRLSGMGAFDSICHSISAISTGGFSTKNAGIQYYGNGKIELVLICAMFVGGVTFLELVKLFKNGTKNFFQNQQIQGYFKITTAAIIIPILHLFFHSNTSMSLKSIIDYTFNIVSSITTTGFSLDGNFFKEPFAKIFLLILAIIGGCSGSTSGGIKIFRVQILYSVLKNHIKKLATPFDLGISKYQNKKIEEKLIVSVISFLILLLMTFALSIVLITLTSRCSENSAITAVTSCLFNIGFDIDYDQLSPISKVILSIDMIIGRLEIIPVVVIFSKVFWKK